MNFLILDGPRDPKAATYAQYRGTYRAHPTYCDGLPKEHEINQLFYWFLEEGAELGVVHNLAKALQYARLLNTHKSKFGQEFSTFEVVAVTNSGVADPIHKPLGFDISSGYSNSLLVTGLKRFESPVLDPIQELYNLLSRHYAPQLNAFSLFDNLEVAGLCLKSMIALQDFSPDLFEGGDLRDFEPIGIYVIEG